MSIMRDRFISKSPFIRPEKQEIPKLIFISCEGPVTEELYFIDIVSTIFSSIEHKIKLASARSSYYSILPENRTQDHLNEQNKSSPMQVVERMENYLTEENYDIENNKHDEFWIVLDVDNHTDQHHISEWNNVLSSCKMKNYQVAVSNPFFEVWLLLHHVDLIQEDCDKAVTNTHAYEKTSHFQLRLCSDCNAPLVNGKEPLLEHYTKDKIVDAIKRAMQLHKTTEEYPQQIGSTVFKLMDKIVGIYNENN